MEKPTLLVCLVIAAAAAAGGCDLSDYPGPYTVSLSAAPAEAGDVFAEGGTLYERGEQVEVRARANSGWTFARWRGDTAGSDNPLALTVYSDLNLTAVFERREGYEAWQRVESGTTLPLRDVHFVDDSTGYVGGDQGTLLKTNDGGTTWNLSTVDRRCGAGTETCDLLSLAFFDADRGYAGTRDGTLLKTLDGGASWQVEALAGLLTNVYFVDDQVGFAAGSSGSPRRNGWFSIYKTTDGGRSWKGVYYGPTVDRLHFPTPEVGYAVVNGSDTRSDPAEVLITRDRGETWSRVYDEPFTQALYDVHFLDANQGFATNLQANLPDTQPPTIARTTNGGANWQIVFDGRDLQNEQFVRAVAFASTSVGLAVRDGFSVLRTDDGGTSWQEEDLSALVDGTGPPALTGVALLGLGKAFVIGEGGTLLKYEE